MNTRLAHPDLSAEKSREATSRTRAAAHASGLEFAWPARLSSLRQLMLLRGIALCGQVAAMTVAVVAEVALPLAPMTVVLSVLVALEVWTWRRLNGGAPTSHAEIGAQLAIDLLAFTLLLAQAGGHGNPFVIFYLLHVTLAALLLPPLVAIGGTVAVIVCFAGLSGVAPLRLATGRPLPPDLLAAGGLVAYALAAAVLSWFVVRIVDAWREDSRLLADAALRAQNDAVVTRIGALAAGAAHELATPLTTIAVIAGEQRRSATTPDARRDADCIAAQVNACKETLASMLAIADHARDTGTETIPVDAWVDGLVAAFRTVRPDVPVTVQRDGPQPVPAIVPDASLKQALLILVNNAADASPHHVDIDARWDATSLRFSVGDRGPGFPRERLATLGRSFFTTKPRGKGTGLGLVLTTSTVEHLGGAVEWSNRPDGGALAVVRLPLSSLSPDRKPPWTR